MRSLLSQVVSRLSRREESLVARSLWSREKSLVSCREESRGVSRCQESLVITRRVSHEESLVARNLSWRGVSRQEESCLVSCEGSLTNCL